MGARPVIYVSGVGSELKDAREVVANVLRRFGVAAVWEEIGIFEPKDKRVALQRRIDTCSGLIQLVGQCYGAEPPPNERPGGRVSYTQHEALYARQRGKKVWYFVLAESYPANPYEPERSELRSLQAAYLARVLAYSPSRQPIEDSHDLEKELLSHRDELNSLRLTTRLWIAAATFFVILGIVIAVWLAQRNSRAGAVEQVGEPAATPLPVPRFR